MSDIVADLELFPSFSLLKMGLDPNPYVVGFE